MAPPKRTKGKPSRFTHPQLETDLRLQRRPWLSPGDPLFQAALDRSYRGMKHVPRDSLPKAVHSKFRRSFDALHEAGLFLYDTVQAGGKRLSRTFVTRTLLGDPGITYKVRLREREKAKRWKGAVGREGASEHCCVFRALHVRCALCCFVLGREGLLCVPCSFVRCALCCYVLLLP